MSKTRWFLSVTAMLVLASQAAAQSDQRAGNRDAEAREAEFAERMKEAEERLAEAARRVAELSSERLGAIGDARRFIVDLSDKPRLGVTIDSDDPGQPVAGVSVIGVTPGSPADDAGIRTGDVLTSINGEPLSAASMDEANMKLFDFMKGVEEGDTLDIEYLRDGNVGKVAVAPRRMSGAMFTMLPPGMRDDDHAGNHVPGFPLAPEFFDRFRFGGGWRGTWGDMELVEVSEGLGRYFGTDKGLLVISAPKSNAFKLQDGDVIQSIDGREPSSVNHCMRILGSYQSGEKLVLKIMRDKRPETIEIEVPDDRSSRVVPRHEQPAMPAAAPMPPTATSPAAAPRPAYDERT